MLRAITSIVTALALAVLITGGSCVACWATVQQAAPAGPCCHQGAGNCDQPDKAPVHEECASQPVGLITVEQNSAYVGKMTPPALIIPPRFDSSDAQRLFELPFQDAVPYSPPDLYLRNSVLTI